jgi:chromosome segregation ATPase
LNSEDNKEWNLIMQLQDKIDQANHKIDEVAIKIEKIKTLIRDYNGLKDRIDLCESRLDKYDANREGQKNLSQSGWQKLGYLTGVIGATAALLSLWWRQ